MKKVNAKIIFLGSTDVGKTSIIKRLIHNTFDIKYECQLVVIFSKRII